jgi:hypothetical protein
MVKPFAQLSARRQLLGPGIESSTVAGDTARPDVVDQNAIAIVRIRILVDPLGVNAGRHSSMLASHHIEVDGSFTPSEA